MATTKVPNNLIDLNGDSGAIAWASGTTAQRPTSPVAGDFRYNTDNANFEFYNGTGWRAISSIPPPVTVNYLVVAGGGGGGQEVAGGGGGAGGLRTSYGSLSGGGGSVEPALSYSSGDVLTISVGGGGSPTGTAGATPTVGSDSYIQLLSSDVVRSHGGGGGGSTYGPGISGGSSGGIGNINYGAGPVGSAYANEGYQGAGVYVFGSSGGGGGAGAAGGSTGAQRVGGSGGIGVAVNILTTSDATTYSVGEVSGSDVYFAGGAGGGAMYLGSGGTGGLGGGANGNGGPGTALAGTPNTGGGGGGSNTNSSGGLGGSGVVILRVLTSVYSGITTGSPIVTTDGSDTILIFKSSGSYTI